MSCRTGGNYSLPDSVENAVCYNGFFENYQVTKSIGVDIEDICVDLNGTRVETPNKRYWLTTQIKEYKIINSYAIEMRPIELNVINNVHGAGIYLYDTSAKEKNSIKSDILLYRYYLGGLIPFLRKYGEFRLLREYLGKYITNK